jgi:predicted ATPase
MIRMLRVRHFKRFPDLTLALRPLTILAGLNGAGKSTLIHALLLTRQALFATSRDPVVALNGPFGLALGEANDMLYHNAEDQVITFALDHDQGTLQVDLRVPADRSVMLDIDRIDGQRPEALQDSGRRFTYLGAERLGPRELLGVAPESSAELGVGEQGQFTAHVLASFERHEIPESLRHPMTERVVTLKTQAELWASEIIRPIGIRATWQPDVIATSLRFAERDSLMDWVRPANMGFGITYALPIIVTGLLARPDDLIVVESPEVHLHPAGQSKLGRFLTRVASVGAQVVVETHSDHFLNGIRLGIVEEQSLPASDAIIQFFGNDLAPVTIGLEAHGSLTEWPPGFFDQLDLDLMALSKAKRRL